MTSYDSFPISEAHRKALEARRKYYDDRPDKLPELPEKVLAATPALGDCLDSYEAGDLCYSFAFEAYASGGDGAFWMDLATYFTQQGHACIDRIIHRNPFE